MHGANGVSAEGQPAKPAKASKRKSFQRASAAGMKPVDSVAGAMHELAMQVGARDAAHTRLLCQPWPEQLGSEGRACIRAHAYGPTDIGHPYQTHSARVYRLMGEAVCTSHHGLSLFPQEEMGEGEGDEVPEGEECEVPVGSGAAAAGAGIEPLALERQGSKKAPVEGTLTLKREGSLKKGEASRRSHERAPSGRVSVTHTHTHTHRIALRQSRL